MQYSDEFKQKVLSIYGTNPEFSISESTYGEAISMRTLLDNGDEAVGLFLERGEHGILKNLIEPDEIIKACESLNFREIYNKAKKLVILQKLVDEWRAIADEEYVAQLRNNR